MLLKIRNIETLWRDVRLLPVIEKENVGRKEDLWDDEKQYGLNKPEILAEFEKGSGDIAVAGQLNSIHNCWSVNRAGVVIGFILVIMPIHTTLKT